MELDTDLGSYDSDDASQGTSGVDASRLLEVLSRIDCHVYIGETLPDGGYREMFTGPGLEALLGGPIPDGVDPATAWDAAVHADDYERQAAASSGHGHGGPVSVEYRVVGYDGVIRWVLDRMWPWPVSPDGRLIYDGVVTDVTELHQTTDALHEALLAAQSANLELAEAHTVAEHQARTDDLTGLRNRRDFAERLDRQLTRAAYDQRPIGLLLIDIDYFKQINDWHGHGAGDQLLTAFAGRLRDATRPDDVVARWGGEEFVVLFTDLGSGNVLAERAEQIRRAIASTPFIVAGQAIGVRVSIGAARSCVALATSDALLAAADGAMYEAKRAGRDRVAVAPAHESILQDSALFAQVVDRSATG
ncbi:MAG TPA: sensor domain-containing diguanylate cyclase [Acidothermaceae bacterium]